ncbi:MAG: recombinase family protein [Acidobacteriia bacterium]|nr:recombinase family protein [Terriglobia bacterium]
MAERVVVYTRVSTEEQAKDGTSLAAQKAACLEYCERQGYRVAKIFVEEGESAKTANRTQLKALLAYCRTEKDIKAVLVHKLDRFARNATDHTQMRALLSGFGVHLRSVTEPIDDSSTGKFMEHVLAAVAELDNNIRTERSVKGMTQRLKDGRWTFSPPLGYRAGRDATGAKTIIPDEHSAPLITQAFEEFATGLHTREQVLRKLTLLGLRTKKGKFLSSQTFSQTLRKPVYAGRIVVPEWNIDVPGKFQPLVTQAVFDNAQAILSGRAVSITPRARNHADFPLRGFVKCGYCTEPLTGSWSKGRSRYYAYYHCEDGCNRETKDVMEAKFEQFIRTLEPNAAYMRLYREIVLDVWRKKQGDSQQMQGVVSRKISQLRENKTKLEEAFVYQKAIDADTYKEMRANLIEELTLAEMELRDAQAEEIEIETVLDFADMVLTNASNLWKAAPVEQKQRLQQVLFPEGVTYSDGKYRTAVTCLLFNGMGTNKIKNERLVALPGIEPGF